MSRIGNMPVDIPSGVTVTVADGQVSVKGPKGEVSRNIPETITVRQEENQVIVTRPDDGRKNKALHGLTRALINNMVKGVTEGFERKLELHGVGYRAQVTGDILVVDCGLSHQVKYKIPNGITIDVDKPATGGAMPITPVSIKGIDNIMVGDVAAHLRSVRPPEPYQGKGIRYADEYVRRKVGKKAG